MEIHISQKEKNDRKVQRRGAGRQDQDLDRGANPIRSTTRWFRSEQEMKYCMN